ncbi:MAG: condensation domain-containing protein [Acidobacteriota bacterium]
MKEIGIDMTSAYSEPKFEVTGELTKAASDDVYVMPTSVAQQRFWILDQLEPGNTSLNMPLALRLTGKLDTAALQRTFNEIVSRHEVLRTTFSKNHGKPVQVVTAERSQHLEIVDLSSHQEPEGEVDRLMVEEAHITFDLARGPLFKTKLLRLGKEDHVLLLTLHHIVCDGWSNGVLVREIGEVYDAFSHGRPSPHDQLPIQYGDFAAWQQDWINSEGFEDQLAYWKQQLGNELPNLEIPTDFPRKKNRASFGAVESLLLPPPLVRALKAMGQREDVTPFMIFLTAFNVLLSRYSGQQDILVGSPTANRQQSETEDLIGAFANTLLLRSNLSGDPSFKELLCRVKEVSLGAFGNQTIPFEKLAETIRPARKRGQLIQIMFIFQTAFMQPMELDQLSIKPMRSVSPGSLFELSLGIVERQEGIRLQLEYNTDLFKAETTKLMLMDLQSVLKSAVLDVNRKASELLHWTTPLRLPEEKTDGLASGSVWTPASAAASSDQDQIEESLAKIWQDVLHIDSIRSDADFFEMGGHSLLAAQLFDEIAKRLKVNLPLATLFTATTIQELAKLIRQEKPEDVWTSMVPINSGGTKIPLFIIHAAGGNILFLKDLARYLGDDQPVYGVQSQGLSGDKLVEKTVEDIADRYLKEITEVQPKGPYFIGGRCFGAYVALEIAQRLRRGGQEVEQLIVFDSGAPAIERLPEVRTKTFNHYARSSWRSLLSGQFHLVFFKWLGERKFARRLGDELRLRKHRKLTGSFLMRNRELERTYRIAAKNYLASRYDGCVTLIRSDEFHALKRKDGHLGWRKLAMGGFKHFVVPGDHLDMFSEPKVKFLAQVVKECLSDSQEVSHTRLSFD